MKNTLSPFKLIVTLLLLVSPVVFAGCSADGLTGAEMQTDAPQVTNSGHAGPQLGTLDPDADENTPPSD